MATPYGRQTPEVVFGILRDRKTNPDGMSTYEQTKTARWGQGAVGEIKGGLIYRDELHESDNKAPRMRFVYKQAFEQNSGYLILDNVLSKRELQSSDQITFFPTCVKS